MQQLMTPIHVVGIGLEGARGLTPAVQQIVRQATLLVGSDRHLSYFPDHPASRIILGDLTQALAQIRQQLSTNADSRIVILASGDPLFFGLGRLLLTELPAEKLTFHPHLSAVQLAFSQLKVPWQDARIISAHGRSLQELTQALQQGVEKIAVLTDSTNTPAAIARLFLALDLPIDYQFWVCENLGGVEQRVQSLTAKVLVAQTFAPLNVVILLRQINAQPLQLAALPLLGLPDQTFFSFSDRPGLMTKREVRVLVLAELALQPGQIIWDIGAGTGSVAIEMARLVPQAKIYAIEKTALGSALIQQNSQRFQVDNVVSIHGSAPEILPSLPNPDRIFIGGSGGNLMQILDFCQTRLPPDCPLVLAFATLEHLNLALSWFKQHNWQVHLLQIQLAHSVPVATLTRLVPLNPVTLVRAIRPCAP